MKKSTQWFISGAMWLCLALITYIIRSSAEQRAFWYGTYDMPAIQVVILYYGLYVISAGFILGIVCFVVGLSKAGIIAVTVNEEHTIDKTTIVVAMQKEPAANAQNNTIIKEVIMMPCEHCESLIPQTSTFCPDCGVRRKQ